MARHNKDMAFYDRGTLTLPGGDSFPVVNTHWEGDHVVSTVNPDFLEWLKANSSFAFDDMLGGNFAARKELRRGIGYWYAFAWIGGKTVKRYIGKSEELDHMKLHEVGWNLRLLRRSYTGAFAD